MNNYIACDLYYERNTCRSMRLGLVCKRKKQRRLLKGDNCGSEKSS